MADRTTQTMVHFSSAFLLPGFDRPQPAGDYRVDHDEDAIEAASHLAWRHVGAFVHLPAIGTHASAQQMVPISQADLHILIEKDQRES